jgi:hypothetical protein
MQYEFKGPRKASFVAVGIYQLLKTQNVFFARIRRENH